ncbi:MAG TPA: SRPBCC domain-containing protein [Opitutaceae bacterium]
MSTAPALTALVTRHFNASPERLYDAWLQPALIGRWMFGPAVRDEEVLRLDVDPRAGGGFSFLVRRQGREIDHVGEYLDLSRPHRLAFTWTTRDSLPATSRVIVAFTPADDGCELTLNHELHPDWSDFVGRTEEAWKKMFNVLAAVLA